MPYWTTAPTVKTHLLYAFVGSIHFEDEEVTLVGTTPSELTHRLLSSGSQTVKWCIGTTPTHETPTLTDEAWSNLTENDIVPGSVLVAVHPILTQVYSEGEDYIIDYEGGRIRRATGSGIATPFVVNVWYLYNIAFTMITDYIIQFDAGTLTRVVTGGIPSGATVLVDYDLTASDVADALIDNAILQAEDKILGRLSSSYGPASVDQGLTTGATELALSIIAQSLAIYQLQHESLDVPDDRAHQWRQLATTLETQAWRTLAPYLDPSSRHAPDKRSNP